MLLEENELLHIQMYNYTKKAELQQQQINLLEEKNSVYKSELYIKEQSIENLKKDLNKKNNTIKGLTIGGVSVTVGLVLFLLLK